MLMMLLTALSVLTDNVLPNLVISTSKTSFLLTNVAITSLCFSLRINPRCLSTLSIISTMLIDRQWCHFPSSRRHFLCCKNFAAEQSLVYVVLLTLQHVRVRPRLDYYRPKCLFPCTTQQGNYQNVCYPCNGRNKAGRKFSIRTPATSLVWH